MKEIHLVLQGKGGVGKSIVSAFLTQQKLSKGYSVLGIDTDPVNGTFSDYPSLNVSYLDIMKDEDINPRKFDELIEEIVSTDSEIVVVDNGASCFIPLASYIKGNNVIEMLCDMGHKVYVHTIIAGGPAQKDTLLGLTSIIENFAPSGAFVVVWLNEFWGKIEQKGKSFEEMKTYTDNVKFIYSIISLPEQKKETFGEDIKQMLTAKLTFDEAIESSDFQVMAKQRLKMFKNEVFQNIAAAV